VGMADTESGPSRVQQFVTIVVMLATLLVILLGAGFAIARGIADNQNTAVDHCQAILQLDRNLRFYEQAIASEKKISPPPPLNLHC
jgi:hypothetical protein